MPSGAWSSCKSWDMARLETSANVSTDVKILQLAAIARDTGSLITLLTLTFSVYSYFKFKFYTLDLTLHITTLTGHIFRCV